MKNDFKAHILFSDIVTYVFKTSEKASVIRFRLKNTKTVKKLDHIIEDFSCFHCVIMKVTNISVYIFCELSWYSM
jgi:hypothetical protein